MVDASAIWWGLGRRTSYRVIARLVGGLGFIPRPSLATSTISSMLAATWLSALATVVLAMFAVVTAWYARKAFREQSREVGLLQQQADLQQKELERQAEERRRAQAVQVYVAATLVPGDGSVATKVYNTSGQPIYDVRVHWLDAGSGVQVGVEDKLWTIGPARRGVSTGLSQTTLHRAPLQWWHIFAILPPCDGRSPPLATWQPSNRVCKPEHP
jgi:membrane protein implicated in regulation of membrane protease activity